MKKIPLVILIAVLFFSCVKEKLELKSIKIVGINNHTFLIDHNRKLIISDRNKKELDTAKLYSDSGEGCNSYLFESGSNFILVDCNGSWFEIDKENGKINLEAWKWKKSLPQNYIGTFIYENGKYKMTKEKSLSIEKIYKYKDPND